MREAGRKSRLLSARTFLFVPGDQPERIIQAFQAKTDAVIIDLEDAVKLENKADARKEVFSLVSKNQSEVGPLILIRTNEATSDEFVEDLQIALDLQVDAIVLPKYSPGIRAIKADEIITKMEAEMNQREPVSVIGLIESTEGVLNLLNSAAIPERIKRLAFGAADLYADLGVAYRPSGPNTDLAMAALVLASAHSHLGSPIDSPHFKIADLKGLQERSLFASEMGFGGKLCIHPNQLTIVEESFNDNVDQKDWATRVINRWSESEEELGAILIDGALVDEAMVKQAKRILGLI